MNTLHTLAPRLVAGLGLLALLGGLGLAASHPAHSTGGPVPVAVTNAPLAVTDADAARQAVSGSLALYGANKFGTLYTIPANKRLIIETVSVIGGRFDTNTYTIEVDTRQNGALGPTFFNLLPNGAPFPAFSQPLRLYADPGSTVVVFIQDNGRNSSNVGLSFSGHLVDL